MPTINSNITNIAFNYLQELEIPVTRTSLKTRWRKYAGQIKSVGVLVLC